MHLTGNWEWICSLGGIIATGREMVSHGLSCLSSVLQASWWPFCLSGSLGCFRIWSMQDLCRRVCALSACCCGASLWRAFFSLAQVAQSIEDHHQEVIGFCRENGFHGLVAYDSDYALCNIPYYFSAHALKLSRNGKSLTTSQYLMHEVAKQLDLNPNRFPIFAALLGRWAPWKRFRFTGSSVLGTYWSIIYIQFSVSLMRKKSLKELWQFPEKLKGYFLYNAKRAQNMR